MKAASAPQTLLRTIPIANTPFAIGSLTKQLTAAAIMLLVRERKLSLSDDLSNYVPSLPGAGRITLRMLLDQNSGLHNYPRLSEHAWPTQGAIPLASLLAILSTDTLDFSPGAKWEYSNSNYAALAAVVERVSGVPFGAFLRTQIFEPLHMTASDFGYAAQQSGAVAIGYVNGKPKRRRSASTSTAEPAALSPPRTTWRCGIWPSCTAP
jgi:CubicO group peptidase (beta-lactamase class C family)